MTLFFVTCLRSVLRSFRCYASTFVALLMAVFAVFFSQSSNAAYVQVYSTIQKGAITFTGNTLELNGSASASTTPGTAGTGGAFIAAGSTGACGTFPTNECVLFYR